MRDVGNFRNFIVRKSVTGLIYGPRNSTINFIQQFCNNKTLYITHEQSEFNLFHVAGNETQRAESLTLICAAPLKHPKFDKLSSEDVLSWLSLCVHTFSQLIDMEMW